MQPWRAQIRSLLLQPGPLVGSGEVESDPALLMAGTAWEKTAMADAQIASAWLRYEPGGRQAW